MVKANDSSPCWQHSTLELPNLNMSASIELRQNKALPTAANHGTFTFSANMVFPRFAVSGIPGVEAGHSNESHRQLQCQPANIQTLLHAANSGPKERYDVSSRGSCEKAIPNVLSGPVPKKFLIFDHSGNQTRLILDPSYYPTPMPIAAFTNPVPACELRDEGKAANTAKLSPMKPVMGEELYENIGEESEMHEDTEEINALLYSDDDDDDDGCSSDCGVAEDDDEMSTGHSPIGTKGSHEKRGQAGVVTEEVATSDGPIKRLRLLNDGYGKSSILNPANPVKPGGYYDYDDDAESSYTEGKIQGDNKAPILGRKRSRQDKIRDKLEILESLIPGGKGKDPLLVLDEAIKYLTSLKLKAKAQGAFNL